MRNVRWIGLLSSLLIVGVLGGLMAPLPSEAVPPMPSLTIDGVPVNDLVFYGPGCGTQAAKNDPAYNACWSIPNTNVTTEATRSATRRIGNWYVGDVTATNQARVLIFDVDTVNVNDDMKLTGVTFTPVVNTTSVTVTVTLINTFNQPAGGQPSGKYYWAMSQGGNVDPYPDTDNTCTGSGVKLTGTANVGDGHSGNLGILNKSNLSCPSLPKGQLGSVTASKAFGPVKQSDGTTDSTCSTGASKCAPTVTYTYLITMKGGDQLQLTDSVVGCSGICLAHGNSVGDLRLLECTDPVFLAQCDPHILAAVAADEAAGVAAGAVEMCDGGNCIYNMVQVTPANKAVGLKFTFTASGPGVDPPLSPFDVITNAVAVGGHLSKNLDPTTVLPRTFNITTFPKGWQADNLSCTSALGTSTWIGSGTNVKGPLTVLTLGAGDILTCVWHIHNEK